MNSPFSTLALGLCLASSANIAQAQTETVKPRAQTVALYNADAPQILNDLLCVRKCEGSDPVCDSAVPKKTDGRCS